MQFGQGPLGLGLWAGTLGLGAWGLGLWGWGVELGSRLGWGSELKGARALWRMTLNYCIVSKEKAMCKPRW